MSRAAMIKHTSGCRGQGRARHQSAAPSPGCCRTSLPAFGTLGPAMVSGYVNIQLLVGFKRARPWSAGALRRRRPRAAAATGQALTLPRGQPAHGTPSALTGLHLGGLLGCRECGGGRLLCCLSCNGVAGLAQASVEIKGECR